MIQIQIKKSMNKFGRMDITFTTKVKYKYQESPQKPSFLLLISDTTPQNSHSPDLDAQRNYSIFPTMKAKASHLNPPIILPLLPTCPPSTRYPCDLNWECATCCTIARYQPVHLRMSKDPKQKNCSKCHGKMIPPLITPQDSVEIEDLRVGECFEYKRIGSFGIFKGSRLKNGKKLNGKRLRSLETVALEW